MKKLIVYLLASFLLTSAKASAEDVYVGTSPATGWNCYLMTETIYWINDLTDFEAKLKMVDSSNIAHFVDYRFWHESDDINRGIYDRVYFFNSQDYRGIVDELETPIEFAMWNLGTSFYADGIQ